MQESTEYSMIYNQLGNQKEIFLSETKLSKFLGPNFSVSTLEKNRQNGRAFCNYIQLNENCRVLYPILYVIERISDITVEDKAQFIVNQINKSAICRRNSVYLNENQIAKLFCISASTVANYRKKNNFIKSLNNTKYSKFEVAKWIIENSIKVDT